MAALSNVLGLFALPGPLNIQFGMTAVPFLLVALFLGPRWGALCGLLGGITQAQKYGHILYVLYTAIQGGVTGYFAQRARETRGAAFLFALGGGFFLFWWIDLLSASHFELKSLATSFADAPSVFGTDIFIPFPLYGTLGATLMVALTWWLVSKPLHPRGIRHFALAGCFGAVSYVPYDAFVLYWVQGYPWLPTWFVLSKDLVQDFVAAVLVASIAQNVRVRGMLNSST
jgi:uncharacterized membrane protein